MPADPASDQSQAGTSHRIARLTGADAALYRAVRLDALRLHPEAFASDFTEEANMSLDAFAARIPQPPGALFGAFARKEAAAERLAGIAGLIVHPRPKLAHKGELVGVYVEAAFRRSGLAHALVSAAIDHARDSGLRVLHLSVTAGNAAARQLYAGFGFRLYGTEPRAMAVAGRFLDNELMALVLD